MITIKSARDIAIMKEGGAILARIRSEVFSRVAVGVRTEELNQYVHDAIVSAGGEPAFIVGGGFPTATCISLNDEIVHGLPSSRTIVDGDVVTIDLGIFYKGFHTDSALTVVAGTSTSEKDRLLSVTRHALQLGIKQARVGRTLGDIGYAVQSYVEKQGFGVVRDLVGHGIGRELHEEPQVMNFGKVGTGLALRAGMVIAIEPMVTAGDWHVIEDEDGIFKTKDGSLSAHFEHTVAITDDGPQILTL